MKKWFGLFLTFMLALVGSLFLFQKNASAKELPKAITDVKVWDTSNGREAIKKDDSYQLIQGAKYQFEISFDLKAYDGNLSDGDTFKFTIPEPFTITSDSFDLIDKATGIAVGKVNAVTNGANKGAIVTVPLQNLADYVKAKGGTQVEDVKGTFYISFTADNLTTNQTVNYDTNETNTPLSNKITVLPRGKSDYSDAIGKENLAKIGGVLSRQPYDSKILDKSGTYAHPWHVRINARQETYNKPLVLEDNISEAGGPMQYIPETVKVTAGYYNSTSFAMTGGKTLVAGTDYQIVYNSSYTHFTLTILNPSSFTADNGKPASFSLNYSTTSPTDGTMVTNTVSISVDGNKIVANTARPATDISMTRSSKVTEGGTISLDTSRRLILYKRDAETGKMLEGAVFKVTTPSGQEIELNATDSDGRTYSESFTAEEIAKGEFTITEIKEPKGYKRLDSPLKVRIEKDGTVRIINNQKATTRNISVSKVWEDNNNQEGLQPTNVVVNLLENGVATGKTVTLSQANNWQASFTDLAINDSNNQAIQYTVEEETVAHYEAGVVTGDQSSGYTITNKRTPEKITVSGTKTWDDANNQDGKRPEKITVRLTKTVDGATSEVAHKEISASDNWNYSFADLPRYEGGKEVTYSVDEDAVAGYTKEVSGYNLTNRYSPEKITVSGTKTWDDADNQDGKRPEKITVRLSKTVDGATSEVTHKEISASDNWNYSFTDLPRYEGGKEVTYSVDEDAVAGYTKEVSGYNLTNRYSPEKITVSGTKTWDDANNQDGKRPATITVNLLADNQKVQTAQVSEASNWTYSFSDLPKFKDGREITYTVSEEAVPAYRVKVDGYNLTNSYSPEKIDLEVTKNWDDGNNQDGIRPKEIEVSLIADNDTANPVMTKKITADAAGKWSMRFEGLPKYKNGLEIKYSITEKAVADYTSTIKDFTITNSYTPKVIDYKVTKTWDDANNQDGKRPDKINITLYKTVAGVKTKVDARELTVANKTSDNIWETTFTNLPKNEAGQEIAYSVEEDEVAGYQSTIKGQEITNHYTPETIKISGSKVWNDGNNQDGKRPDKITVTIKHGDNVVDTIEVAPDASGAWSFTSKDLPKYENGQEIKYDVTEEGVTTYQSKVELTGQDSKGNQQYTITNEHTPEKISVSGSKTWDDEDNRDGKRPASTTIRLLKNGQEVAHAVLSATTGWKYQFDSLPRYENGKEVVYTISEDPIEGYDTKVTGFDTYSKRRVSDETNNPSDPEEPKKGKGQASEVDVPAATKGAGQKRVLPRTGQTQTAFMEAAGALLLLGSLTYFVKRKEA